MPRTSRSSQVSTGHLRHSYAYTIPPFSITILGRLFSAIRSMRESKTRGAMYWFANQNATATSTAQTSITAIFTLWPNSMLRPSPGELLFPLCSHQGNEANEEFLLSAWRILSAPGRRNRYRGGPPDLPGRAGRQRTRRGSQFEVGGREGAWSVCCPFKGNSCVGGRVPRALPWADEL